MAPTDQAEFLRQTREIISCLLEDEDEPCDRQIDTLETDGGDHFDAVLVADKLRRVADTLNDDATFKAALSDLRSAAAQEVVDEVFSHGVHAMCQTLVSKGPEVAPEMQLIEASVAFLLYVKKSFPELKNKIQGAMMSFLTTNVGTWVNQQGGWENVV